MDAFLDGYRKIFDPYNDMPKRNVNESSFNSDKKNIQKDWIKIGKDIEGAILNYESSQK